MKKKYYWIFILAVAVILIIYYVIFYSIFSPIRTFCLQDDDCIGTCDCGCINKYMYCPLEILCELGPPDCICSDNKCTTPYDSVEKQFCRFDDTDCLDTCGGWLCQCNRTFETNVIIKDSEDAKNAANVYINQEIPKLKSKITKNGEVHTQILNVSSNENIKYNRDDSYFWHIRYLVIGCPSYNYKGNLNLTKCPEEIKCDWNLESCRDYFFDFNKQNNRPLWINAYNYLHITNDGGIYDILYCGPI